jgi:hypothetical protein
LVKREKQRNKPQSTRQPSAKKAGPPKLPPVSEEMKAWSAALLAEVNDWPLVNTRSFFGLHALYRGTRIFGLLPRTRAIGTASSIAYKLESPTPQMRRKLENDPRIQTTRMKSHRWHTLVLDSGRDLRDALAWLETAYKRAW